MADTFEALIGAAFIDGSWGAIHLILDQFMPSFITHFALHHDQMLLDLKSSIINFYAKKGINCQLISDKK